MLLRKPDLVCQQAVELVTDYLDDNLSRADRRRFERHLATCPHCTEYLAQIRAVVDLAGHAEPDDLTPDAQDELTALFRRWKSDPH